MIKKLKTTNQKYIQREKVQVRPHTTVIHHPHKLNIPTRINHLRQVLHKYIQGSQNRQRVPRESQHTGSPHSPRHHAIRTENHQEYQEQGYLNQRVVEPNDHRYKYNRDPYTYFHSILELLNLVVPLVDFFFVFLVHFEELVADLNADVFRFKPVVDGVRVVNCGLVDVLDF